MVLILMTMMEWHSPNETWSTLSVSIMESRHYASHDRVFTTKLGSPQSLMIQEGTHNLNVTLKGFWGLFGQNTTNHTISSPKRRFILNPNGPWTDLQP